MKSEYIGLCFLVLVCTSRVYCQDAAEPLSGRDVLSIGGGAVYVREVLESASIPLNDCIFLANVYSDRPRNGDVIILRRIVRSRNEEGILEEPSELGFSAMVFRNGEEDSRIYKIAPREVSELTKEAVFLLRNQRVGVQVVNTITAGGGSSNEKRMIFFVPNLSMASIGWMWYAAENC